MSTTRDNPKATSVSWRLVAILIASVSVAILIVANAHLVYVALASQPDCVPHAKSVGTNGIFRAARSAC